MLSLNDNKIFNILIYCLDGNEDISLKILKIKNNEIINEIKNEYIETHFYNWLNYDLHIRNKLSKVIIEYNNLPDYEQDYYIIHNVNNVKLNGISLDLYFEYYNSNLFNLGLNTEYIRIASLKECNKLKWWSTTEKNNLLWNKIHDYITFPLNIKIYKYNFNNSNIYNANNLYETLINTDDFRNPTIKEKNEIVNNFLKIYYHYSLIPMLELGFEQDFNTGYLIVDKNLCIF